MFRGFLGHRSTGSTSSLNANEEPKALEEAMQAAAYMMDDDMDRAIEELSRGNSTFHKHGLGVVTFLRAVLGFEKEVMKEALEKLTDAEAAASAEESRARRHPEVSGSKIYSAGSEYSLILAECRLMSAVLGVLTESVTEAVKSFYKLRQAYIALEAIQQEEKRYLERNGLSDQSYDTPSDNLSSASGSTSNLDGSTVTGTEASSVSGEDSDEDDFVDADETHAETQTEKYLGRLSTDADVAKDLDKMTIKENSRQQLAGLRRRSSTFQEGPGMDIFGDNVVDGFIHSGSNMCFGVLQILISMIPPSFGMLTKILGFKGDRIRGLALLWQASKFTNINGAFAGLVILGYYNGFVGFCDILPLHGKGAHPKARCTALLKSFRVQYPHSRLWILEEARQLSSDRRMGEAIKLLEETPDANLKQIRALQAFEKSLSYMSTHQYEKCAAGFQACVKLNNWSHGLYYYVAASALIEQYRELAAEGSPDAAVVKAKAAEVLKKVPEHVGKKRMMGRQLPFDIFVGRKIQKWEQRAKDWDCDVVDAVGVSPIEEMIYFWNGYKRQSPEHLETSLRKLEWSKSAANSHWSKESIDEQSIYSLLKAVILRNQGKTAAAREVMQTEVMSHPWSEFKGGLKDNWTLPVSHYETAVSYWTDYCQQDSQASLHECKKWLDKVSTWEAYDLDARIGMRVKTGQETVNKELDALMTS